MAPERRGVLPARYRPPCSSVLDGGQLAREGLQDRDLVSVAPDDVSSDPGAVVAELAVAGLLVSAPVCGDDVDRGCQLTNVDPLIAAVLDAPASALVSNSRGLDDLIAHAHRSYTLPLQRRPTNREKERK